VNGKQHSLVGLGAGLTAGLLAGAGPVGLAVWAGVAGITSAGPTSPDMDQDHRWRRADTVLPDEALGHGGPMKHRGLTHWFGLPLAAAGLVYLNDIVLLVNGRPLPVEWVLWAAIVGWSSHIVADAAFGKGGVPLLGWYGNVGLELSQDGILARAVAGAAPVAACLLWAATAGLDLGWLYDSATTVAGR